MGAFGNVTAPGGQMPAGNDGMTGLGELFSLQFGFAMQNLQTGEEGALIGQGLSEEEQKALEALMALMQQLAAILQEDGVKVEGRVRTKRRQTKRKSWSR
jgi:hypothetical protein